MKFSQITTLILAATCGWSASLTGQNMSQEDFHEILEPYVGAWNGEYRIYSQKDELLNRFAVNRTYWWDNDILLSRVVYDFGEQSQTFYHRIVLSEGNPYSFITDELASGSVRSALKGETLRGTLVWTRVLPKESLPVRISERISEREGTRFLEFWGDQEARDAQGGAMLVRIDGFMTQLSASQEASAGTPASSTPDDFSSTQPTPTDSLTPHEQALRDRQNAETGSVAEQASKPESPPSRAEQRRLAAERKKAEEQQKREEAQKQREERRAEQARLREEQKAKEAQARKEADERKAEELRAKEEAARAEAAKKQEERRLREEAKQAEAQKKKDEEQARIDARKAERERKAAEDAAKREAARKPIVPKTSEPANVDKKSTDAIATDTPVPAPIFNAEIQEELEKLKIIGVRDRPGQECIVVEHYLLFKLGEPLNIKHPCSLTKIDATHLYFTDDAGYVYRIARPDLSQQEVPEAHPDEENPQ